ncbi:MAG: dihydroorotate dehydrogenase [Candidatus Aenigmarchaeota archaeon]|nr:dihydroorotate dehydrogenase [Candidatus Aenigmarchaeota archaeon]
MNSLKVNLGKITLSTPFMNASGIFSFPSVLKRIESFGFGAVVTKSIGFSPRKGFEEPIIVDVGDGSFINAVGLSNPGYEAIVEEIKSLSPFLNPLIVSVFGSLEELEEIVPAVEKVCDGIELNLSCPNLMPGEKHGIVIGKDPDLVFKYVRKVRDLTKKHLQVKLTPNVEDITKIGMSAVEGGADAIVAINTVFPSTKLDDEGNFILTNKFGGLSGKKVKPIGVAKIKKLSEISEVPLIGVGGIFSFEDVLEYVLAGAVAVQLGSVFAYMTTEDVKKFMESMVEKAKNFLQENGYATWEEFIDEVHQR